MNKESVNLNSGQKSILCIGAHPDDCEFCCSGTAAGWAAAGNKVTIASVTDGRSGHHVMPGDKVAARRRIEARNAAERIGATSIVMDTPDGFLEPTLEYRFQIIEMIRRVAPDVIITNRPNDYHPDHRYTSQLIQDSAYMLMVPNVLPEVPPLAYNPAIFYWADTFTYPRAFRADAAVGIDGVVQTKKEMLMCHESQVYEWLPFISKYDQPVPDQPELRPEWFDGYFEKWPKSVDPDSIMALLIDLYGKEKAAGIQHAEAFELCEYGTVPGPDEVKAIFADAYVE